MNPTPKVEMGIESIIQQFDIICLKCRKRLYMKFGQIEKVAMFTHLANCKGRKK